MQKGMASQTAHSGYCRIPPNEVTLLRPQARTKFVAGSPKLDGSTSVGLKHAQCQGSQRGSMNRIVAFIPGVKSAKHKPGKSNGWLRRSIAAVIVTLGLVAVPVLHDAIPHEHPDLGHLRKRRCYS